MGEPDSFGLLCNLEGIRVFRYAIGDMSDEKPVPNEASGKPLKITKIVIDRDLCIGAASCVVIAPGTFQMDEENKAYLVDIDAHDAATIRMAAESCPTKAIFLYDEEGNQVYP